MNHPSSNPKLILEAIAHRTQALNGKLRIAERRAKLNGQDMPVRTDMTVPEVATVDLEASALIREAKAKVAAEQARIRRGAAL
jgi:hypothetical protein